jgi:hypothetical protein
MKGNDSAGLMRWDTTKTNCYVRYTGKFEDSGREYYLDTIRFTRNIIVASPGNNSVYIFSVTGITAPTKSITFGTAAANPLIGKVAAITRQVERYLFITCSHRATN